MSVTSGSPIDLQHQARAELGGMVALTVVVWIIWGAIYFLVVPSWAFSVVSFDQGAAAAFGITTTAWVVLATRHRVPLRRAIPVLVAGGAASAVWLPVLWLSVGLVPVAIHTMLFFAIPLAFIPLLLWGAFCASWSLSLDTRCERAHRESDAPERGEAKGAARL